MLAGPFAGALLAVSLLAGCRPVEGVVPPICPEGIPVTIGYGPRPVIGWPPQCAVTGVRVYRYHRGAGWVVWSLHVGNGREGLLAPLRYGAIPLDAVVVKAPERLHPRASYRLFLFFASRGDGSPVSAATVSFMPCPSLGPGQPVHGEPCQELKVRALPMDEG